MVHSSTTYKLKHGKRFPYNKARGLKNCMPIPKAIAEIIMENFIRMQQTYSQVESRTIGNANRLIEKGR